MPCDICKENFGHLEGCARALVQQTDPKNILQPKKCLHPNTRNFRYSKKVHGRSGYTQICVRCGAEVNS